MIKSMTAFANKGINDGRVQITWEMRSVNHRYLDANVYLPEEFASKDTELKSLIRKKIGRGKVEAKLVCKAIGEEYYSDIKFNHALVKALLDAQVNLNAIAQQSSTENLAPLSVLDVLNYPGIKKSAEIDYSQYDKAINILFKDVLNILIESREEEGARLKEMLTNRAGNITFIVKQVRKRRPEVVAAMREKIIKRISDLDIEADNGRLEQELVIQAQRLDVDEELDRLDSHIEELNAVLERDEPVGRRLDFLMQELNREANTLASKANDAKTTRDSVELKVLIEQMREQVMNLE